MRKKAAVAGSAGFLLIAPGVVAGVVPWRLTRWQPGAALPVPVRVTGGLLTAAGSATLIGSFAQFALEGQGTPAPPAPTEQLVVHGLYRHVRNPMYLAVLAVITGQALLLGRPVLLGYAAAVGGAFTAFVYGYEQPTLARRYGAQYEAYRRAVPGWWPRRRAARQVRPSCPGAPPAMPASGWLPILLGRLQAGAVGATGRDRAQGDLLTMRDRQHRRPARIPADMVGHSTVAWPAQRRSERGVRGGLRHGQAVGRMVVTSSAMPTRRRYP